LTRCSKARPRQCDTPPWRKARRSRYGTWGERMVSYFVLYRGGSSSPEAFQACYETRHAEILRQFPNIRSLILHRPAAWTDPFPVRRGETMLLAQMQFDSAGD